MNNTNPLIHPLTGGEVNTLFNTAKLASVSPTRRAKIQSRIWQNFNQGTSLNASITLAWDARFDLLDTLTTHKKVI